MEWTFFCGEWNWVFHLMLGTFFFQPFLFSFLQRADNCIRLLKGTRVLYFGRSVCLWRQKVSGRPSVERCQSKHEIIRMESPPPIFTCFSLGSVTANLSRWQGGGRVARRSLPSLVFIGFRAGWRVRLRRSVGLNVLYSNTIQMYHTMPQFGGDEELCFCVWHIYFVTLVANYSVHLQKNIFYLFKTKALSHSFFIYLFCWLCFCDLLLSFWGFVFSRFFFLYIILSNVYYSMIFNFII